MICFSVAVFAGVVPFLFVRAEAGDALLQVVSGRCLNLNYHALHSSQQLAPRTDNNVIIFYITTFAVSSILKLYVPYTNQDHNKIYALLSIFWLNKSMYCVNTNFKSFSTVSVTC